MTPKLLHAVERDAYHEAAEYAQTLMLASAQMFRNLAARARTARAEPLGAPPRGLLMMPPHEQRDVDNVYEYHKYIESDA